MTYVFVRHSAKCQHKDDPNYKRCKCPKWIYNNRDRISAKTRSWERAESKATALDEGTPVAASGESRKTVAEAVEAYLTAAQNQGAGPDTLAKKIRTFQADSKSSPSLLQWCRSHGIKFIAEIGTEHMIRWRSSWVGASITRSKKQGMVCGFFYFCLRMKWVETNAMLGVGSIKVTVEPTGYFDRDEMAAILDAIAKHDDARWSDADKERCRVLTLVMRWSGLAIRDAVTMKRDRLGSNDALFLYRAKTGHPVRVLLPPEVAQALREVPPGKNPNPEYFFWSGNGLPKSAVADWQRVYRRVFAAAGVVGHPHMFRDTFAVETLLSGASLEQVAMLLGHKNPVTTAKHYMPWVKARQEALDVAVRRAWTADNTDSGIRRVV